jgi:transcriptional regulator with XRE-family HTH domain
LKYQPKSYTIKPSTNKGGDIVFSITFRDSYETRLLIAKNGQSLRRFSEVNGISHAYLSQILTGKRNPSPTVAYKIANGLNQSIEDIFLINLVDIKNNQPKRKRCLNDSD